MGSRQPRALQASKRWKRPQALDGMMRGSCLQYTSHFCHNYLPDLAGIVQKALRIGEMCLFATLRTGFSAGIVQKALYRKSCNLENRFFGFNCAHSSSALVEDG